jgi:para-aminobenzoate synthetase component I
LACLYDLVVAWDHQTQQSWIFSSGFPEKEPAQRLAHAQTRLAWAFALLQQPAKVQQPLQPITMTPIQSNFTHEGYLQAVRQVKEYIRAGDIFQACLTQRFETHVEGRLAPWELYKYLRQRNAAPFAAYVATPQFAIASASPERFIRLQQRQVEITGL